MAKRVVNLVTGFNFNKICGCSVQDRAAKSVARYLELEEKTCDMHDRDKIGRSAIGELVRMDGNGGVVNPFEPGKLILVSFICYNILYHDITNNFCSTGTKLAAKLRLQAKHFNSMHQNCVKYDAFLKQHPEFPTNSILCDLNETRISSRHLEYFVVFGVIILFEYSE